MFVFVTAWIIETILIVLYLCYYDDMVAINACGCNWWQHVRGRGSRGRGTWQPARAPASCWWRRKHPPALLRASPSDNPVVLCLRRCASSDASASQEFGYHAFWALLMLIGASVWAAKVDSRKDETGYDQCEFGSFQGSAVR